MRLTYKGDYALKATLYLATHYGNNPVTIHEMAKHLDIPIKFLEQILLDLKRGSFVESRRGKVGGYILARHPSNIKLGEVVRFIDGPIEPIACTDKRYSGCNDVYRCAFRKIWQDVSEATSKIIDNVTFEDLAAKVSRQKEAVIYQI